MFLSFYHFISYLLPANIYVHIVVREISILVSVCGTYIIYFWFEKFRISSSGCKYLVLFKLWTVYGFGLLWSVRLGWDCPVPKCSSKCVRYKICILVWGISALLLATNFISVMNSWLPCCSLPYCFTTQTK